jgi:hypothetical protein
MFLLGLAILIKLLLVFNANANTATRVNNEHKSYRYVKNWLTKH